MKFLTKILNAIDFLAIAIGVIGGATVIFVFVFWGLFGVLNQLGRMWSNEDDRIICIIALAAIAWCAVRWKSLNQK
jgi:hypothetical protein